MNDEDLKRIVEKHEVNPLELSEQMHICVKLIKMSESLTKQELMDSEKANDLLFRLNTDKREQYLEAQLEVSQIYGVHTVPGKSNVQLIENVNTIFHIAEKLQEEGDED
jgi:hypothetical protein